jgi:putative FmdB family regulatory protein
MPIYEYRCSSCKAELEKLQKISEPPLVECPECGKDTLVKLISASSFRLKGSGWYETDFKTGNKKNGAAEETPAKTDPGNNSASASDGNKTTSKAADTKTATESSGKKESNSNASKGEAKSSASTAGNTNSQTKSGG